MERDCNTCKWHTQADPMFPSRCPECLSTNDLDYWEPMNIEPTELPETDFHPVDRPKHYMLFPDGTEAIDVIRASLTPEEFRGYCKGNFLKYRLRAGHKDDPWQDIEKSEAYRKMMYEVE